MQTDPVRPHPTPDWTDSPPYSARGKPTPIRLPSNYRFLAFSAAFRPFALDRPDGIRAEVGGEGLVIIGFAEKQKYFSCMGKYLTFRVGIIQ